MSAVALAEHALMLMMMVLRRIPQAQHNLAVGELYRPVGAELEGRRLGLVGFGSSARELSTRAAAMGMRVRAVDLHAVEPAEARRWGAERVDGVETLDRMLAEVDVVSLHLHLTPATTHTLSAERLRLLPPRAWSSTSHAARSSTRRRSRTPCGAASWPGPGSTCSPSSPPIPARGC